MKLVLRELIPNGVQNGNVGLHYNILIVSFAVTFMSSVLLVFDQNMDFGNTRIVLSFFVLTIVTRIGIRRLEQEKDTICDE